ncbi:MAG: ADP-ribosylglycohydrolase family protein [bacterium]|nr:ADP-ribosylglycohydrolase family protein [bacterium]
MLLAHRYCGVLAGVLTGDALGAPYETWDSAKIQEDFKARGGLVPFDYDDPWDKDGHSPAGRPTDDSELTAALGTSLFRTNAEENDLYRRFRSCVIDKKSVLCSLPAYGFGGTTRRALTPSTYREAQVQPRMQPPIPSNGSLMRTAPVALRHHGDFKAIVETARRASRITHTHPLAVECTVFYTVVLDRLLAGYSFMQATGAARRSLRTLLTEDSLVEYLDFGREASYKMLEEPDEPDAHTRGGALITLQVALWATAHAKTFREGITMTVGFGGDTDTYGAVAGGLLGAIYGTEAIPPEWKSAMSGQGYETMEGIALRLFHVRSNEYGR